MSLFCIFPDCDKHALAGEYCYGHESQLKKEAKEKLKVKKVYKIPAKSKKKAKEDSKYGPLRKKFLEEYPICQAGITGQCNLPAQEIHHTSISALNFLNTETWLGVCVEHHRMIEQVLSAEDRREKGLLTD